MDPLGRIKKFRNKKLQPGKRRVEFKLKINLWKVLISIFLIIFFLPFVISIFEFQRLETKLETSRALTDIKEKKVKEVLKI